ncbi:MAG: cell division protein ZapA [Schleiferiaceae bacterium]|nr:cell division protein ZapA [Schleiferiaceae bacterium]
MNDTLKIKVSIAGRSYPLTIERQEEERVRKAVTVIHSAMQRFEERYAVGDKQDALAMCALQLANQMLGLRGGEDHSKESEALLGRLQSVQAQLDAVLSQS